MNKEILKNTTILITRDIEVDTGFAALLEAQGAEVIHFPTIKIIPVKDYSEFDNHINDFGKFDYLIFSSANAVKYFARRISDIGANISFEKIKVVAVGTATASECKINNIPVDILPNEFSAKGVFETLGSFNLNEKNFLIPSSVIARKELRESLAEAGANVFAVPVYDNVIPPDEETKEPKQLLQNNKPDLFIFTSPSTFNNFVEIIKPLDIQKYFRNTEIAAIGSVTAAAISKTGLEVNIVPDEFTMISLVEKIIQYYKKKDNPS